MEVKRLEEKIGSQNASPPNSPQNAPKTNGGGSSITDRLKALKKLEDAGLISKEEAAAKRKEILKNL